MATGEEKKPDDADVVEFPAPAGWIKLIPRKHDTPQRNDVIFVSPSGEEIKNKKQLEQFLKSHPGGPRASEFDWGTGDTPRRSARLSGKMKAVEASVSQSPKKKRKISNEKSNAPAEGEATDKKDSAAKEMKGSADVPIVDSKDIGDGEAVSGEALPENPKVEDVEKKTYTEAVLEKHPAVEASDETKIVSENTNVEKADTMATNAKIEESNEPCPELPGAKIDESKEAAPEPGVKNYEPEDPCRNEKETLDGKADGVETKSHLNQDNLKEKQEAGNPGDRYPALQEPETGS